MSATTAIVLLAMEAGPLADLRGWPPVGSLLESLAGALRGGPGLSAAEIARLRLWSGRWRSLSGPVRRFYAEEVDAAGGHPGVIDSGIWSVLDGSTPTRKQAVAIRLRFRDRFGYNPTFTLT